MNSHRIGEITAVALALALLTGCQSTPAPPGPPAASPTPSPSASTEPQPSQSLPADAVLGLTGEVRARNGAVLDLTVVVHAPLAWSAPAAEARVAAISTWCVDEVDAGVMESQDYALAQVDYSATLRGTTAWPEDRPILVMPTAQSGLSLAASGAVKQLEVLPHAPSPGDYVPHCRQSAYLLGPGSGSSYLGFPGDAAALAGWVGFRYGFDGDVPAGYVATIPFGGTDPQELDFSGCTAVVTALGKELGASSADWGEDFTPEHCTIGGPTP